MNRSRLTAAMALVFSAVATQAADLVLTPPAGGGVRVTNSAGDVTRFRIFDDGTVTFSGDLFRGSDRFLHAASTNTFLGVQSGNFTMTGASNTACGYQALQANTSGASNTALGRGALLANTIGAENTAVGRNALTDNTQGEFNTAVGNNALLNNSFGGNNTATGYGALSFNLGGSSNVAAGVNALRANTSGTSNTAAGVAALVNNTVGQSNTAFGKQALAGNVSGNSNIAIGDGAGFFTTGDSNILIGSEGVATEDRTIRIGESLHTRTFITGIRGKTTGSANAIPVMIDGNGQLGTVSSSGRFKDDVADMDDASSDLMKLRPVTFHYKADQDPEGRTLQYGLVAEEVAEVYPGLVAHSPDGKVETVMYQFLPTMMLNEMQKQQRTIEAQATELSHVRAELAEIKRMLGRTR